MVQRTLPAWRSTGWGDVFFAESGTGNVYKETVSQSRYAKYAYFRPPLPRTQPTHRGGSWMGRGIFYVATSELVYKEAPSYGTYVQSRDRHGSHRIDAIAVDAAATSISLPPRRERT